MSDRSAKTCSQCGREFSVNHFTKDKYTTDGLNRRCRECVAKNYRKMKKENPDALRRQNEASRAKKREVYRNDPERRALVLRRNRAYNRALDPAKKKARQLVRRLRDVYNLTLERYEALYNAAGGKCQICGVEIAPEHRTDADQEGVKRNIDHDHNTGRVRGLLCPPCNRGLGYFGDDLMNYVRAARYLGRHERVCPHKNTSAG